LYKNGVKLLNW